MQSTATMIDRFTADSAFFVTAIEANFSAKENFSFRVTLDAETYQSPTGEEIDVPEISAVVSGNEHELKIDMMQRDIDTIKRAELDVLHIKMLLMSAVIGEMQFAESCGDSYSSIDSEVQDTVTLLHQSRQIPADMVAA